MSGIQTWSLGLDMDNEQTGEYDRMRGEYLGLMASLEFNLTFLLVEWLDVSNHRDEFRQWFIEAPIPFRAKLRLYETLTKDSVMLEQFGDLPAQMREFYDFRNMLAHSFRQSERVTTSRGVEVPPERVSFEVLDDHLKRLSSLESLVGSLLMSRLEGPPEMVFTDDYADWPYGLFLP